jgi:hypothetical protein
MRAWHGKPDEPIEVEHYSWVTWAEIAIIGTLVVALVVAAGMVAR